MRGIGLVLVGAALGIAPPARAQAPDTLTLDRAIATALEHSRAVAEAEAGVAGARGLVREAWASVLPDVSASASYQRNFKVQEAFLPAFFFDTAAGPNDVVPVRIGADNTWFAGLSFSQPLF
jgi:outer membrane protein TolC